MKVAEAMHQCCGGYALVFYDSNATPDYTILLSLALDCGNIEGIALYYAYMLQGLCINVA